MKETCNLNNKKHLLNMIHTSIYMFTYAMFTHQIPLYKNFIYKHTYIVKISCNSNYFFVTTNFVDIFKLGIFAKRTK